MKKQFPLEQSEELEAVVSCFGEEFVSVDWSGDELKGVISVVLEPRLQPIVISATDGKDYRQFETKQLSPVDLRFNLPVEYPAEQAMIDVDCMWMPTSMRSTMLKRLGDVINENLGSPILFLCCEDVKKFLESTEIAELRLEGNHFARKNKLRPMEVLDLVRNECEKAEQLEFEGHCHDCDVCFENKLGRECVRFSPCGHTFCRECVTAYFNERLTSQEVSPLTCLSDGCESSVSQKLIIELLGQEAFDRYERILLSRVLDTMDDLAVCPRVACQKPAALSQATENLGTCLICGYSFCTKCRRTFHGVQPCRSKFDISVSALVENEDGTWGLREVSLQEYLRATPEERIEMGWWYGGIENLEVCRLFRNMLIYLEIKS
ncbi:IBR domain protein [Ancylostoma caninum]|uniref:RBR-type E3 ubiquitin transferase n=1 Tax=Ancylostoma caninum TaxID=29170 RepID=A0A368H838_ANCCA|nr:IBR domain protein [Ancylostoma caninum]